MPGPRRQARALERDKAAAQGGSHMDDHLAALSGIVSRLAGYDPQSAGPARLLGEAAFLAALLGFVFLPGSPGHQPPPPGCVFSGAGPVRAETAIGIGPRGTPCLYWTSGRYHVRARNPRVHR